MAQMLWRGPETGQIARPAVEALMTHSMTGIRTVSIPEDGQHAALRLHVETLGFRLLRDNPTPNRGR